MGKGKEIKRGQDAERLINDPLYKEAFDTTKNLLIQLMLQTDISEETERDRIYMTIKSLELVEQHIRSVLETGQLAEKGQEYFN